VDDPPGVDVLDPLDDLLGDHKNGFNRELAPAEGEEVLEGLSEHVHNHEVVVAFGSVVEDLGDGLSNDGGV
jgi:hypothetical protein